MVRLPPHRRNNSYEWAGI